MVSMSPNGPIHACMPAVTTQPCQLELAKLVEMVNPKTSDWSSPPRSNVCRAGLKPKESMVGWLCRAVSSVFLDCLAKTQEVDEDILLKGENACTTKTPLKRGGDNAGNAVWGSPQAIFTREPARKVAFQAVPKVRVHYYSGLFCRYELEIAPLIRHRFVDLATVDRARVGYSPLFVQACPSSIFLAAKA